MIKVNEKYEKFINLIPKCSTLFDSAKCNIKEIHKSVAEERIRLEQLRDQEDLNAQELRKQEELTAQNCANRKREYFKRCLKKKR